MQEESDTLALATPELLAKLPERIEHLLALFIDEADLFVGVAAAHRRRKVQIELQLVFRQTFARWIDLHQCGRRHDRRFDNCYLGADGPLDAKLRAVGHSRRAGK